MAVKAYFLSGPTAAHYTTLNAAISAGKQRGLVTIPRLFWDGSALAATAHEFLFGNGVYAYEDGSVRVEATEFGFAPSVSSWTATLVWQMDSQVNSAPVALMLPGLLDSASDLQVIIGYIFYPGNNAALSSSVVVIYNMEETITDIQQITALNIISGAESVSMSNVRENAWDWLVLENKDTKTANVALEIVTQVPNRCLGSMRLRYRLPATASVLTTKMETPAGASQITSGVIQGGSDVAYSTWIPLAYQESIQQLLAPAIITCYVTIPAGASAGFSHILFSTKTRIYNSVDL